jgi:cobalt-zinc-cadmium resistance protein CzcA
VILTASAAAMGFFPMAFSSSAGAEVQKPLATVVIGGLVTATLLTLIVLPVIYMVVYTGGIKDRLSKYGLKVILVLISFSLVPVVTHAQSPTIDLNSAIELAKENNMELKNAALNVESRKALVKTAWSLGETQFSYTNGQIDGEMIDYNWVISQNFGAPFAQSSLANFMKLNVSMSEAEQRLIIRDIELETSKMYYELVWRQQRYQLIEQDYRQYEEAVKIADLKYQSGEGNLLSKVMMESEYESLRLKLKQALADRVQARQGLMKILHSEVAYEAGLDSITKIELDFSADSLLEYYENSAILDYLQEGVTVARQNIKVQQSTISPSLGFGYFNQSLNNVRGFDGWQLSVSMPLWFRPNSGQVQSAKIQHEMYSNAVEQQRFNMLSDLRVLDVQRNTLIDQLETFELVSLRNANLIMDNADLLYKNGEIEYLEYIRSIGQAISMKLNYLDNLHEYNLVTLKMNYLVK